MKKVIMKVLVFLAVMVLWMVAGTGTVFASVQKVADEQWIPYAADEAGTDFFYSPKNIQRKPGNIVSVWVKAVYPEKQSRFREAKLLWEIDCTKRSLRGISAKSARRDGTPVNITKPSVWSDIPDGSTAESLHEVVCKEPEKGKNRHLENFTENM